MDYFVFDTKGKLIEFHAEQFLKDINKNRNILHNLETRRAELEGYGIKAVQYDKVKVQTSGIGDPTAELAVMATHLDSQITLYYFWISAYEDAIRQMDSDDRWILECMFSGRHGAYRTAMDHFCVEKSTVYRMRQKAINEFSEFMVGAIL